MQWEKTYEIGIPVVDSQHKRLFELVRELDQALQSGLRPRAIRDLLVALDQYKTRHFQIEERYMEETDYPGLAEQQQAHAFFTERFSRLQDDFDQAGLTPALVSSIQQELAEWLKAHVTGLDMQFGTYYRSRAR